MKKQIQLIVNTLLMAVAVSNLAVGLEEIRISSLSESRLTEQLSIMHLRSL